MSVDSHSFISGALSLDAADWLEVLTELDQEVQRQVYERIKAVAKAKGDEEKEDILEPSNDPNEYFRRVAEKLIEMKRKLRQTMKRLDTLERGGVATMPFPALTSSPLPNKRSIGMKRQKSWNGMLSPRAPGYQDGRKVSYRFGTANLQVLRPSEYPSTKEDSKPPSAELELCYAHGYQGKEDWARQNLHFVKTPVGETDESNSYIIYHLAGAGVVLNTKDRSQHFFLGHNDDVTCISVDPRPGSTMVATGQTDPRDMGDKDEPKIYLWDYRTGEEILLLDSAHWGSVLRTQFSYHHDYLYSIGGGEDHPIAVWDISSKVLNGLKEPGKLIEQPVTKEEIWGFCVSPVKQTNCEEELLIFGRKKCLNTLLKKVPVNKKSKRTELKFDMKGVLFAQLPAIKADRNKQPSVIICAQYFPDGNYVIGGNRGCLYVCSRNVPLKRFEAHDGYVGCVCINKAGDVVYSAGGGGKIRSWKYTNDMGNVNLEPLWETKESLEIPGHDFEFKPRALCFDEEKDTLYIGSKTCQIMEYPAKQPDKRSVIVDGHDGQIWGLATCPIEGFEHYYLTGGWDNVVKLWNADTKQVVDTLEFPLPPGQKKGEEIVACVWSTDGEYIACGSNSSWVYLLSWKANKKLKLVARHHLKAKSGRQQEEVSYLRFSPTGKELAVAHMDSNMYIFSITKWKTPVERTEALIEEAKNNENPDEGDFTTDVKLECWDPLPHRAAPTHIQWSADGKFVKSFTRDYEVAHWQVDVKSRQSAFYPFTPDPDECEWADDPLIAGWDVQGCYLKEWDGTDLNDVTLTNDSNFAIAGDDFGLVRLHKFPCISNESGTYKEYRGHSAFVVGVEMCRDDKYLISCGGNDMAIFQWSLQKNDASTDL